MQRINYILAGKLHYYIRSITIPFLLLFSFVEFDPISAQCPGADVCEDAYLFCSLDEMNGFSCSTTGTTDGTCWPNCTPGGIPEHRAWWKFVCQGGNVTFTLNVGTCVGPFGVGDLTIGIWGDCNCVEQIMCPNFQVWHNMSYTYPPVYLKPCKIYYLNIDVSHEVCDFTLNNSGSGPPFLSPFGYINNAPSGIIEPVCVGFCNYKIFVNPQPGNCEPIYVWTLDGTEVGDHSNEIKLDFPKEGDFVICVTAHTGDLQSGSICSQVGPKCATIKVRPLPDKTALPKTICNEATNPDGYSWHSQTIYASGFYREHYKDNNCCLYDSVIQFTVLPVPQPPDVYYITCENEPYVDLLGHQWSPCIDQWIINLPKTTDPFKCDSSIRLTAINVDFKPQWQARCVSGKVELSPNIIILNKCDVGESYKFDYKWYKKNDTLQKTITTDERLIVDTVNQDYCLDVKVKVRLGNISSDCSKTFCDTINEAQVKGTAENRLLSYCDSAVINGKSYYQSIQFTQQLKNVFGCDSIIITDLNISKSSSTNLVVSTCDSILINNQVYTQSGKYFQSFVNSSNCDSILNLDLTIPKSNKVDLNFSACDSILVNGQKYVQSGSYSQAYINSSGCDSIVNLDLTILKGGKTDLSFNSCDSVIVNGKIYTTSGDYFQTFKSSSQCDSILSLHVNITNTNLAQLQVSACDSTKINGQIYKQSGKYSQLLKNVNGCDSTLNIDLTVSKNTVSNFNLTSCDSAIINGQRYLQSGSYTQLLQNVNHCDSTLNINLALQKSSNSDLTISSCDSTLVNGQLYKQSGNYIQVLKNGNLCDSTLNIHFTQLNKSFSNLSFISCDSIIVNNQIYKKSGNYIQTLINSNQCDSILNLNVNISKSNSSNSNLFACDSVSVNGQTYYQSGNYKQNLKNADLCDSALNLDLTIYKSSSINFTLKACDSVNINGQIYTQSGNYPFYLKDAHQCDSTIKIQLTINNSTKSNLSQTACDSLEVNGIRYYTSGQYMQDLVASTGCDSTLTLDLIIKPGNPSALIAGTDTSICEGEVIKLNGKFAGQANFFWHSSNGSFDNPNSLNTNYYSTAIGNDRIYLQATDDCKEWLDSLDVHILPRQIVQVTGDTILNPCKEISFTASGGTNYKWTPSSFIDCLDPPCSRVLLKSTTATRFTISTDGPCVVPANLNLALSKIESDIYLPNVFSPNGDNINDVFLPVFNCEQVDYYSLQIFDRWGNLLFESHQKDKGWNGKYQDQNMNPGVYPYFIQYKLHGSEKKVNAGDITLIR